MLNFRILQVKISNRDFGWSLLLRMTNNANLKDPTDSGASLIICTLLVRIASIGSTSDQNVQPFIPNGRRAFKVVRVERKCIYALSEQRLEIPESDLDSPEEAGRFFEVN